MRRDQGWRGAGVAGCGLEKGRSGLEGIGMGWNGLEWAGMGWKGPDPRAEEPWGAPVSEVLRSGHSTDWDV
jgi:hypothetical protein